MGHDVEEVFFIAEASSVRRPAYGNYTLLLFYADTTQIILEKELYNGGGVIAKRRAVSTWSNSNVS